MNAEYFSILFHFSIDHILAHHFAFTTLDSKFSARTKTVFSPAIPDAFLVSKMNYHVLLLSDFTGVQR